MLTLGPALRTLSLYVLPNPSFDIPSSNRYPAKKYRGQYRHVVYAPKVSILKDRRRNQTVTSAKPKTPMTENRSRTAEEKDTKVSANPDALPRADSNVDCQCSCHTSNGNKISKELSSPQAAGAPGPWLISTNVVDFAYPPGQLSEAALDTPSPSPQYRSNVKAHQLPDPSTFPGIDLTEFFGEGLGSYSTSSAKRYSAPAHLGPSLRVPRGEESFAQVVAHDYAAALAFNESLLAAKIDAEFAIPGPSRSMNSTRPKTYPSSQSFSSRLFELELSPIFEDTPVFASGSGTCVSFKREESAGPQSSVKDGPKDSEGVSTDSSESSYGELIEARTFGSPRYQGSSTRIPEHPTSPRSERSIEKECLDTPEESVHSNETSQSKSLNLSASCGGDTKTKTWPVPSLTFTQPTPESTKSSNFLTQEHSIDELEDDHVTASRRDDSHSMRQVEEVDPVGRNCSFYTNSVWMDTVGSSVNTHDIEGPSRLLGHLLVDEHGSVLLEDDTTQAIGRATERPALFRRTTVTGGRESASAEASTGTRKRWSLMSSLKRRSTTTNERSDGSSASVWTRLSMVLSSTGRKTPESSVVDSSDEDPMALACPLTAGLQDISGDGSAWNEKQEIDAEVQEVSSVQLAQEYENLEHQSGQRMGNLKKNMMSNRVTVFLKSIKTKISRYRTVRRRRSIAKWEGKSIPPKMV